MVQRRDGDSEQPNAGSRQVIFLAMGPTSQRHALVDRVHPRRPVPKILAPRVATRPDEQASESVPAQVAYAAEGAVGASPREVAPGSGSPSARPRGSVATLASGDHGEGPGSLTCAQCGRPFTPRRRRSDARFCNPRCRAAWHAARDAAKLAAIEAAATRTVELVRELRAAPVTRQAAGRRVGMSQ